MSILSHLNLRAASRLLLTVGAAGLLAACSSEPEQPKGPTPEEIAKEAQGAFVASVPGVYEGVLPCADCSARGIRSRRADDRGRHGHLRAGSLGRSGLEGRSAGTRPAPS